MKRVLWLVVALVILAIPAFMVFVLPTIQSYKVDVPDYQRPGKLITIDQGWSETQRTQYHHTPQGTQIMPYKWFLALEQPCLWVFGCGKFSDQDYLGKFGFIAGVKDAEMNPDSLPVGFARHEQFRNPFTGNTYTAVGFNCAACHTAELHYNSHAIRVEGGPAMSNLGEFLKATGIALIMTKTMPLRYSRFEASVLGQGANASQKVALRQEFETYLNAQVVEANESTRRGVFNTVEGFGRTDALARIGNIVFATDMENWDNLAPTNAPVRFPQIWDASWFTWVQYNSSISNPMTRNIGEAMGVKAPTKLFGCCADKFRSTVDYQAIWDLEKLLSGPEPYKGLVSPEWPAVLPPLDQAKVARGREVYRDRCMKCHLPPVDELAADLKDKREYWVMRDGTHPFLNVREVSIDYIGTDPNQAMDFYYRVAGSGDLKLGGLTAAEGLDYLTKKMAIQFYTDSKFPPVVQREWSGWQDPMAVGIRATKVYRPRPLNGAWSLGTYLHNGSVPNMYELLSPLAERTKEFWVGSRNFDPVKVGYEYKQGPGLFKYDVTTSGNSNRGHQFEGDGKTLGKGVIGALISPEDRYALIEFLKSM